MLRRFVTALLFVSIPTVPLSAQQTPDQKPRKVKQKLKKATATDIIALDRQIGRASCRERV